MQKFNEVFAYLQKKEYPGESDKVRKRSIRRSATLYEIKDGDVVLKGTNRRWVANEKEQRRILIACHDDSLGKRKLETNYLMFLRFLITTLSIDAMSLGTSRLYLSIVITGK